MSRTKEWLRFGSLVAVTLALAAAFIMVVDLPEQSLAQQPESRVIQPRPAPIEAAQPVVDLGNAFSAVAEAVRPSVVFINAERRIETTTPENHPDLPAPFDRFFQDPRQDQQPRAGSGSGFIVSPNGHIITNNHVVQGFDRIDVQLFDGREFTATVVGRDENTDIAVIKINANDLPAVSVADSDSLRVGEWVLAIGNPLGAEFSFSVTAGIVSGRGRGLRGLQPNNQWAIQDFIQTDAAINPGNSGGPLVNIRGQVVGVNAAIASRTGYYSGYSFAIPMNLVRTVADQLIEHGKVTRAALGIQVQDADDRDAEYVQLDEVRGVVVQDFSIENSPAEKAGMQQGDVIVEVDGRRVNYVAQLQQIVGFKRPGDVIDVVVQRRGGERKTLKVRLIEAGGEPAQVAAAETESAEEPAFQNKLGLAVEELTAQEAARDERLGPDNRGLVVVDIDPNGPARAEQLTLPDSRTGSIDVITHVDGTRVTTIAELREVLNGVQPGEIISLRVFYLRGQLSGSRVIRVRAGG